MEANKMLVTEFFLTGLTDSPKLQVHLFLVFWVNYLTTMMGNLELIFLIWKDLHLHTPMYLFLGSLAFVDACSSSFVTPRMFVNIFDRVKWCFPLSAWLNTIFLIPVPPRNTSSWWWWPMTICSYMQAFALSTGNVQQMLHLVDKYVICNWFSATYNSCIIII